MAVTINYTFISESVVGTNEVVEQQSLYTSASLVGTTLPISLGGQHQKISLISLHTSESLIGNNNFVELVGQHDKPINTYVPPSAAYVTTGLMLHLDAEQSGSGQTFGDIGGTTWTTSPLWESLDNYDSGSPHTVGNTNASTPFGVGDSIETTGSIALRLDQFDSPPFSTENGVKFLDLDGSNDRGVGGIGISNLLNSDGGASLWRFEDLSHSTLEMWVYPRSGGDNAGVIFNIKAEQGIRLDQDSSTRLGFLIGTGGSGTRQNYATSVISNDAWYHIVVTINKSDNELKLYVNNNQKTWATTTFNNLSGINTVNTNNPHPFLKVGERYSANESFRGGIAIIRMYDFPLSSEQVSQNYNAELSRFE